MALFGSGRDASLIRSVNRELINRFVDVEIEWYKLSLPDTRENIYGESDNKQYYRPVKLHCLVLKEPLEMAGDDYGLEGTRTGTFAFLRDDLKDISAIIETGDILWWDLEYHEVDVVHGSQYWSGRNPDTNLGFTEGEITEFGYSVSIVCDTHVTRRNRLNLVEVRSGGVNTEYQLPRNL